jgi:hypothetical protein
LNVSVHGERKKLENRVIYDRIPAIEMPKAILMLK